LHLIEFFIALPSDVLIWLWFALTAFALVRLDFVFGIPAFAETSNLVAAPTCAFACRLTELTAAPTQEVGTTPPTELANEPSKVTFAIKLTHSHFTLLARVPPTNAVLQGKIRLAAQAAAFRNYKAFVTSTAVAS
jgi:hypothetical protein